MRNFLIRSKQVSWLRTSFSHSGPILSSLLSYHEQEPSGSHHQNKNKGSDIVDNQSIDGWLPDEVLPCMHHDRTWNKVEYLRPPDQNIENGTLFHTKKATYTYTSSAQYATHGHMRTLSSCCCHVADSTKPASYCTGRPIFFFGDYPQHSIYAWKR